MMKFIYPKYMEGDPINMDLVASIREESTVIWQKIVDKWEINFKSVDGKIIHCWWTKNESLFEAEQARLRRLIEFDTDFSRDIGQDEGQV